MQENNTMNKFIDIIKSEVVKAFVEAGYDEKFGMVSISNRPDLCEYQCNGAMAAAKAYKKAPIMIANDVVAILSKSAVLESVEAVMPGFINMKIDRAFVSQYLMDMAADEHLSIQQAECPKTIMIDYGGPNVAKPLHVGHLRSAIIGESIKRISRAVGHKVVGDVHLGDWGLQMGLIITELRKRQPELVYFQDDYEGEYPEEAPFTISELEEIYPCASGKSKEDEAYKAEALEATKQLQMGKRGYRAIWNHIINVSVTDLKKNYKNLNVDFDLWKGESDAQPYIPDMVQYMNTAIFQSIQLFLEFCFRETGYGKARLSIHRLFCKQTLRVREKFESSNKHFIAVVTCNVYVNVRFHGIKICNIVRLAVFPEQILTGLEVLHAVDHIGYNCTRSGQLTCALTVEHDITGCVSAYHNTIENIIYTCKLAAAMY
jgi:hypothetical protein